MHAAETAMVVGFLEFVRSTSSMVLAAASNFSFTGFSRDGSNGELMEAAAGGATKVYDCCDMCGFTRRRRLVGGEMIELCSENCQSSRWNFEQNSICAHTKSSFAMPGKNVSLLMASEVSEIHKHSDKILFPYEEFIELFSCERPGHAPCGLINGGNSCFVNVVLQCLTYTRPLAAYFLEKDHKTQCRMDRWCFLCDFQTHVERASWSHTAFIPINILSRLHNIRSNLERGEQEDAHEFMRFAIDKLQSVFINAFDGEKTTHPRYQETSFVQHIFGGCLQSQVICSKCNNVSNKFDHMMDLTVEIHGDVESLEECLDQFTAEELLHGDNMYKCYCCNAYVMARKRLAIQQAPNILTIALKRFQANTTHSYSHAPKITRTSDLLVGEEGTSSSSDKLNKGVTFPEMLDLRSYMNGVEDGNDVYELYAVIVHVEMLNSFGHYICYVKDFGGTWYRIDDDKVSAVGLDQVLSQKAYMLLYSRICPRPSCLLPVALLNEQKNVKIETVDESTIKPLNSADMQPAKHSEVEANGRVESLSAISAEDAKKDVEMARRDSCLPTSTTESLDSHCLYNSPKEDLPQRLDFFKARDTNAGLSRDSDTAKNCTFAKNGRYDISPVTTGEVQREKSGSCAYMAGTAKSGAMPNPISAPHSSGRRWKNTASDIYSSVSLDDGIREAPSRKSFGLSSDVQLKPLSALGRKRRNELFKQENGVSVGSGWKSPRIHLDSSPRFFDNNRFWKYD